MRRRDFIAGAVASAGFAPWQVRAQAKKVPVVGVVWHAANEQEEAPFLEPFRASLRDTGYVEGKNIALELRFPAERPELFESMARELAERRVDVLVAVSPLAAAAAKRATSTIPIVFVIHPNPVEAGIVASLGHPGGNITGLSNLVGGLSGKQIELLREIIPGLKRVAVLVMPAFGPAGPRFADEAAAAAVRLGVEAIGKRQRERIKHAGSRRAAGERWSDDRVEQEDRVAQAERRSTESSGDPVSAAPGEPALHHGVRHEKRHDDEQDRAVGKAGVGGIR